jgi:hypothetical protein
MKLSTLRIAALLAMGTLAQAAHAAPAYSLAGNMLVRFDTSAPAAVTSVGTLSGDTSSLSGLDFRPADGALYGFRASDSTIYRVDTATGQTTRVSTAGAVNGSPIGIDFNPVPDRLRVVSPAENNLRINVGTGGTTVDGALAYAAGDANVGANPNIVEAAYINNDNNAATGTTLYYLDNMLDVLVTTANPNGGVLNTVGSLGVDADDFIGFDVFTNAAGLNTAFASLRVAGQQGLYTIDLGTGAATLVGNLGFDGLTGLAVATVPEPGTLALSGLAVLALLSLNRRRGLAPARVA